MLIRNEKNDFNLIATKTLFDGHRIHVISQCDSLKDLSEVYSHIYCNLTIQNGRCNHENIETLIKVIFLHYSSQMFDEGVFVVSASSIDAVWYYHLKHLPSCISSAGLIAFYFGVKVKQFCEQFANIGLVAGFNSWNYDKNAKS